MTQFFLFIFTSLFFLSSQAVELHKTPGFEADIRFTNPQCGPYYYDKEVPTADGTGMLTKKPENVYCKYTDKRKSAKRPRSPFTKMTQWFRADDTQEIFIAALSFSSSGVKRSLCSALRKGVRVTLTLDSKKDVAELYADFQECAKEYKGYDPEASHFMGQTLGHRKGLGWAHNKLILINPSSDLIKISFGSANFSSGVDVHHENWNFLQVSKDTYFAQAHLCLMNGILKAGSSKRAYQKFIRTCKNEISFTEETDIQTFFVPGEGERAEKVLYDSIENSEAIDIAAHRFMHSGIIRALKKKLNEEDYEQMRFVGDDDLYWLQFGQVLGPNMKVEYYKVKGLKKLGMEVKYMETNHFGQAPFLHHNKYMVFRDLGANGAVFTGAGNFTKSAFAGKTTNFENFYYTTIPSIVEAYKVQYDYVWEKLATSPGNMPNKNVEP